jgi:DNA replicative helicase MCM subunit Mcm2 (Cdc46/Mcm family)
MIDFKALGLNVIPCWNKSKKPSIDWGPYQKIQYTGLLSTNNAIICGVTSGNLVVIDLDDLTLGPLIFKDFEGLKNNTLIVETGKKGYHIYTRVTGELPKTKRITHPDGRHLDIQSQGAYVVAPGSIHPDTGREYKIISTTTNIMTTDIGGLVNHLKELGFGGTAGLPTVDELSKGVGAGNRNNAAFKYSCGVLERLEFNKDMAWAEIQLWNERCTPPLPLQELESVFTSAFRRAKRPAQLTPQNGKEEENHENVGVRKIRQISSKDEGESISFNAFIAEVGEYRTVATLITGFCPNCLMEHDFPGEGYVNPKLPKCATCKVNLQVKTLAETTDMVEIVLQEPQEEVKNNQPYRLMGRVIGENVFNVSPGESKTFTGTFKSFTERGKSNNEVFILIEELESLTEPEDVTMNEKDLGNLKPFITMENLVKCVCPIVYGLDLAKEVMLLTIVGGEMECGRRGDINSFWAGNPGQGKTELLKFAQTITDNSRYVVGTGATGTSLTYAMVKMPDGTMRPQAGAMVMNKFVFLDEFDKMAKESKNSLLQVIESKKANMNKGGSTVEADAKAVCIFAANPKFGKWDDGLTIVENLDVPPPFLSRMDWIVGFVKTNKILSRMIAEHALGGAAKIDKPMMEPLQLKHYLNYARKLNPIPTPGAKTKLIDYYMKTQEVLESGEKIPMETRQVIGFLRSAIARSKLLLKTTVDEQDAEEIIKLHRKSLESLNLKIQGDTIQSMFEDTNISKDNAFQKTWHKLSDESNQASKEEFFKKLIELYPRHFADTFVCEEYWNKKEKHFLLQTSGKYRMSL